MFALFFAVSTASIIGWVTINMPTGSLLRISAMGVIGCVLMTGVLSTLFFIKVNMA